MTTPAAVNVLSVMDAAVELGGGNANFNMILARDAVAELIEADREYDAATVEYAEAEADGDDDLVCNALRKLQWAKDRRSTALARCRGAQ